MLTLAAVLSAAITSAAVAQGYPPGQQPPPNPICQRLESQLASIDQGANGGGAKAEQIRRYEEAASRQQSELDRLRAQARRQGCDNSGFFSLFSGQSAQCGPINNQIQQMRGNLDQITSNLERLRGGMGASEDNGQRRSVLLALAQNNCGPQYANAVRGNGGFFENLFGGNGGGPEGGGIIAPENNGAAAGTFRTVCARSCDGYYFPISFATVPGRFADDEHTCKALCPNAEATLYTYRNPGEDISSAVSLSGQPYSQSPNAFKYRQQYDKACSCKAAGQTWSDALKNIDDRAAAAQRGDIIVTDERSKKMAQPPKNGKAPPAKTAPAQAPAAAANPPAAPAANSTAGDKPIRSVGPKFLQNPQ
jgi:hypothetical protein